MFTRRGFLKGMLGLAAAPAICKAENLMKIFVPPQELVLGRGLTRPLAFLGGDFDGDTISIQRIIDERVTELMAMAPPSFDTLNEIATALSHDRDFADKVAAQLKIAPCRPAVVTRYPITGRDSFLVL